MGLGDHGPHCLEHLHATGYSIAKDSGLYRSAADKAGMPNVQIESEGECDAQWLLRTHPFQPPKTEPSTLLLVVVNAGGMTTVSTSLCGASICKLTDVA